MADDCVFCSIISGVLSSAVLYQDEDTIAILDLRQSNEGHSLVIPKRHVEQVYDLDDRTASALSKTVVHVARAIREVFSPQGLSIWQSNGQAAFQEVPHVHFHVFPRYVGDRHLVVYPSEIVHLAKERTVDSLQKLALPLRDRLASKSFVFEKAT